MWKFNLNFREWWNFVSEAKPIKCNKVDFESKISDKAIFDHFRGSPGKFSNFCFIIVVCLFLGKSYRKRKSWNSISKWVKMFSTINLLKN